MSSDRGADGRTNDDLARSPEAMLRSRALKLVHWIAPGTPAPRLASILENIEDSKLELILIVLEDWLERVEPEIDPQPSNEFVEALMQAWLSGPWELLAMLNGWPQLDPPEIDPNPPTEFAEELVQAWLSGPWDLDSLRQRTAEVLMEDVLPGEFGPIVRSIYTGFVGRPHWRRQATLVKRVVDDPGVAGPVIRARISALDGVYAQHPKGEPAPKRPGWLERIEAPNRRIRQPAMSRGVRPWPVPQISTVRDLARFLENSGIDGPGHLVAAMDPMSIRETSRATRSRYHRYWRGRRLIEAPDATLRRVQQTVTASILRCVPVHEAAHGFYPRRGVLTAVQPHVRQHTVIVVDLEAFFPSIEAPRVHGLFQALGYPECVARALSDLCTTKCLVLPERRDGTRITDAERARFERRHLPSGAPTSPDLANLIAYRLDCRLSGLAAACDVHYTRYADDLIFSGGSELAVHRFLRRVEQVISAEGFTINPRKTRKMTQSVQQRVLGLVLNDRPRIPRRDFENLRAWLFNLARDGVEAQDREGRPDLREHLNGRVAWVRQVEPERAGPLEDLLARIDW